VHLSSAFTTAAWRDNVTCLFKKYVWRSFTCYHSVELYQSNLCHLFAVVE
jgi:hypothetical protein